VPARGARLLAEKRAGRVLSLAGSASLGVDAVEDARALAAQEVQAAMESFAVVRWCGSPWHVGENGIDPVGIDQKPPPMVLVPLPVQGTNGIAQLSNARAPGIAGCWIGDQTVADLRVLVQNSPPPPSRQHACVPVMASAAPLPSPWFPAEFALAFWRRRVKRQSSSSPGRRCALD